MERAGRHNAVGCVSAAGSWFMLKGVEFLSSVRQRPKTFDALQSNTYKPIPVNDIVLELADIANQEP